ncbi:FAD-dependent oxidoreductase [Salinibacter ruber]|uniref:FAD-dependent oxidoreductase n=1 Tax=Salinibacter ruber TaxID=146919 RepID=UPI00216908C6
MQRPTGGTTRPPRRPRGPRRGRTRRRTRPPSSNARTGGGRLHVAAAETATEHPGYLDGAIEAGRRAARALA